MGGAGLSDVLGNSSCSTEHQGPVVRASISPSNSRAKLVAFSDPRCQTLTAFPFLISSDTSQHVPMDMKGKQHHSVAFLP